MRVGQNEIRGVLPAFVRRLAVPGAGLADEFTTGTGA